LETMERIFGGTDKVIIDQSGNGQNVVPFLPLDQLMRQQPQSTAPRAAATQGRMSGLGHRPTVRRPPRPYQNGRSS
ncbi:MAG: hypothetical protein ACK4ST_04890, partial [Elioraea tepidiphila]